MSIDERAETAAIPRSEISALSFPLREPVALPLTLPFSAPFPLAPTPRAAAAVRSPEMLWLSAVECSADRDRERCHPVCTMIAVTSRSSVSATCGFSRQSPRRSISNPPRNQLAMAVWPCAPLPRKCSIVSGPACLPASNRVLVSLRADWLNPVLLETSRSLWAKLNRACPPLAIAPSWLSLIKPPRHICAASSGVRLRPMSPFWSMAIWRFDSSTPCSRSSAWVRVSRSRSTMPVSRSLRARSTMPSAPPSAISTWFPVVPASVRMKESRRAASRTDTPAAAAPCAKPALSAWCRCSPIWAELRTPSGPISRWASSLPDRSAKS